MPDYGNYFPYRDDFPAVPPSQAGADVTATWAADLPNYIQVRRSRGSSRPLLCHGDNRTVSLDGRYWGFVPRANIVGRPLFVYWFIYRARQSV